MAQEEALSELTLEDISVDQEGRVVITNPEIAERLKAAAERKPTPTPTPTNQTCPTNTTAGCGPTNTVKNCGCKLAAAE